MTVPEKAERLGTLDVLAENPPRAYFPPLKDGCPSESPNDHLRSTTACAGFPGVDTAKVQVVLKTGASEQVKAKKALSTFLACLPDILVISDAEDTLNGHHVVDVLADLPASYADDNPDWDAYEAQKKIIAEGEDVKKSGGGWRLDRFKFLPMVEKAYEVNPHADWYVFIEDDIYVFWDSFYRLVSLLDPSQRHFLGTAVPGANHTFFGYGGGGTILSQGLLHGLLEGRQQRLSDEFEALVKRDCCGDAVLAYAIYDRLGVRIKNAFPSLSGEGPNALGVSEETWCIPLTTLHRVPIEKMESLWKWERCRPHSEVSLVQPTIPRRLLMHDLGTDHPRHGHESSACSHLAEQFNVGELGQLLRPVRAFLEEIWRPLSSSLSRALYERSSLLTMELRRRSMSHST